MPLPLLSSIPQLMIAVNVNEQLHRFDVVVVPQAPALGLTASNRVGQPIARVHIRWTPIPDDFDAGPGVLPPPTILNPFVSQRFCMLDGALDKGRACWPSVPTNQTTPRGRSVLMSKLMRT